MSIRLLVFADKSFKKMIQIEEELSFCIEFTFSAIPLHIVAKGFKISMVIYPPKIYVMLCDTFTRRIYGIFYGSSQVDERTNNILESQ